MSLARAPIFLVFIVAAALLWLAPADALAHSVGLSRAAFSARGDTVTAELSFARAEVAPADALAIEVSAGGARCPGTLDGSSLTESDGVTIRARFVCPAPASRLEVDEAGLFAKLAHGHRQIVEADGATEMLLYEGNTRFSFDASGGEPAQARVSFGAMLWMGVLHILEGYDHLAFVFALVLVGGRLRSLVGVLTAFTVAHSITLGLAATGMVHPPSSLIEPLVAVSIAYVGVENFFVKSADRRWRITFPFGLIHGFAFASALREIDLPPARVPLALLAFNLGVEVGQLLVMAPLLGAVYALSRYAWWKRYGVPALSLAVVALAVWLFVERVTGGAA